LLTKKDPMTMGRHDRAAVQKLVCSALVLGAFACSSNGVADDLGSHSEPGLRGIFGVYSFQSLDGASETLYSLRADGVERTLIFETAPALTPETEVEVWGQEQGDTIRVSDFAAIEADMPGVEREALVDAPPFPSRSVAFVRVDIGAGINLGEAQAQVAMFGTQAGNNSVKQFYRHASYQTQDITGSVFGPRNHAMRDCSLTEVNNLASALRPQIEGTFQHYYWYLGSRSSNCAWTTLFQLGRPAQPARDTWYNGSASCLTLYHGLGHNLGMPNSSSMKCGGSVFADDPGTSCTHSEYGDAYDAMGSGCHHVNAVHKVHQGWLQGCNGVEIRGGRTFRLLPLELECNGVQVLQVAMPKTRPFTARSSAYNLEFYYLELRTKRGFDAGIELAPTVLVHVGEDYRDSSQGGRNTWILDLNPATPAVDGLKQGQAFSDPAGGVSFTVTALNANFATVQVSTNRAGAPTCLDGSPIVAPGPSTCGG
jgi:hypothetical protein